MGFSEGSFGGSEDEVDVLEQPENTASEQEGTDNQQEVQSTSTTGSTEVSQDALPHPELKVGSTVGEDNQKPQEVQAANVLGDTGGLQSSLPEIENFSTSTVIPSELGVGGTASEDIQTQQEGSSTTSVSNTEIPQGSLEQASNFATTTSPVVPSESGVESTTSMVEKEETRGRLVERIREIVEDTKTALRMSLYGVPKMLEEDESGMVDFIRYPEHYGFPGKLNNSVARYLIKKGGAEEVYLFLDQFENLNNDLAQYYISRNQTNSIKSSLASFTGLGNDTAEYFISNNLFKEMSSSLGSFENLDKNMGLRLIEAGVDVNTLLRHKEVFNNLTKEEIVAHFKKCNRIKHLGNEICTMYRNNGAGSEQAKELLFMGGKDSVANNLSLLNEWHHSTLFANFDKETVLQVMPNNFNFVRFLNPLHTYGFSYDEEKDLYDYFSSNCDFGNVDSISHLLDLSSKMREDNQPHNVVESKEIFGESFSAYSFIVVHDLLEGKEPSEELRMLGIDKTGKEGIEILQKVAKHLLESFNNAEINPKELVILQQSRLAREMLANISGFKEGRWGNRSDANLLKKIDSVYRSYKDGILPTLPEGYYPSKVYDEIWKLGANKEYTFTEDIIARYAVLRDDMLGALDAINEKDGIGKLVVNARQKISDIYTTIEKQIVGIDLSNPKANFIRNSLEKKRELLSAYLNVSAPMSLHQGLDVLSSYKELESPLRQLIFAGVLRKYPGQVENMSRLEVSPSVESLSSLVEFVNHLADEDMYSEYFSNNKRLAKAFQKVVSVESLSIGLDNARRDASLEGKTRLQFIPAKGLMLEISGQIANACWADKSLSINESMPNMSVVIMRARPGEKTERIVGAALLIETFSPSTGEKVLVLRGTNPTENYINTIEASGFYDAITDYVKETAKNRGMVPAIVIDGGRGGSATNREALYSEMALRRAEMRNILVDDTTTRFNNYDITQCTYRLD